MDRVPPVCVSRTARLRLWHHCDITRHHRAVGLLRCALIVASLRSSHRDPPQVWTDIAWSVCFFASGDWLMDARTYSKHGGVWQEQRWYGSNLVLFFTAGPV